MKSINIYCFLFLLFALKFDLPSIYSKKKEIFQASLTFINDVEHCFHFKPKYLLFETKIYTPSEKKKKSYLYFRLHEI